MQRSLALLSFLAVACKPAASPVAPTQPSAQPTTGSATHGGDPAIAGDDPSVRAPGRALPADADRRRQEGLRAFDEGRFTDARRIFDELLAEHRDNPSLQALSAAARQAENEARSGAALTLARTPALRVNAPPWRYTLRREAPLREQGPKPKLVQVSQARNQITDDEAWFQRHGVSLPLWDVPNAFMNKTGNLPSQVPERYGDLPIVRAISHPDHAVLLYGPDYSGGTVVVVVESSGQVRALFDLEAFRGAPKGVAADAGFIDQRVSWGQAQDGVLFLSTGHNTYAKSSGGENAYITAIDLANGEILWRSDPLVANAVNFVLRDGWILTGYGFTAEPDFLFVLDARTGKVATKQKLKSGPSFLLMKGDDLLVRTYDTDYVFTLK